MASSRDDFIIAIRSAFLKKSTKQKFSLLTLIFLSIFIIILSGINFSPINKIKSYINEVIYRSSFVVSIPENLIVQSYIKIKKYSNFYKDYENNEKELKNLRSKEISSNIIISENNELKNLIEDYTLSSNKILAKVIVDHQSPFLKTIIINKGSSEGIKIGTNIFDKNFLVGRVIEVNIKSSRVLLLSDLNSSIPISITPGNVQAIVIGNGNSSGQIKYIKDNLIGNIQEESIAYTSGAGSIFKSGIPVGRVIKNDNNLIVSFYSDFQQLKYVFVEIEKEIINKTDIDDENLEKTISDTEMIKLDLLNDQIKILNETKEEFIEVNQALKSKTNELNNKIFDLQKKLNIEKEKNKQNVTDQEELDFLRLNLIFSSKCQRSTFRKGFKVGTPEYRKCIINRGKNTND